MQLVIRNNNIYGLWVGILTVSEIFYEMKGVGHGPGGPLWDPWSLKEQEYIWFIVGDLNVSKIISIL